MKFISVLLVWISASLSPLIAQLQLQIHDVDVEGSLIFPGVFGSLQDQLIVTGFNYNTPNDKYDSRHLQLSIVVLNKDGSTVGSTEVLFEGEQLSNNSSSPLLARLSGDTLYVAGVVFEPEFFVRYYRPFVAKFSLSTQKLLQLHLLDDEDYIEEFLVERRFGHGTSKIVVDSSRILYLINSARAVDNNVRIRGLYHSVFDNSAIDSVALTFEMPEGISLSQSSFGYSTMADTSIVLLFEIRLEGKKGFMVVAFDDEGNKRWHTIVMPKEGYRMSTLSNVRNITVLSDTLLCVYHGISNEQFNGDDRMFLAAINDKGEAQWTQSTPSKGLYGQRIINLRYFPETNEIYTFGTYNRLSTAAPIIPNTLHYLLVMRPDNGEQTHIEVDDGTWQEVGRILDIYQTAPNSYSLVGEANAGEGIRRPLFATLTRTPVSIAEEEEQKRFSLFPNPADAYLRLSHDEATDIASFSITDLMGRTVHSGTHTSSPATISIRHLPQGTYIFSSTSTSGERFSQIFIVSR